MTKPDAGRVASAAAPKRQSLVLASASKIRARLLEGAGIALEICPAAIDEGSLRDSLRAEGLDGARAAEALAEMKAQQVSRRFPGRPVLGADQILECDGAWLEKPADLDDARRQLLALRGREHTLHSSAVLVLDGARLWARGEKAVMTMRDFSDDFLAEYLARSGPSVLGSVGAYQLEAMGAQLFSRIDGDYFTILGLPLLPVIDVLREQGMLGEDQ